MYIVSKCEYTQPTVNNLTSLLDINFDFDKQRRSKTFSEASHLYLLGNTQSHKVCIFFSPLRFADCGSY